MDADNLGMNIQDVRRARLKQLIKEQFNNRQADFIAATEINQGELSGLLRKKSFGEKKARSVELSVGIARGWLDRESDHAPTAAINTDQDPRAALLVAHFFWLTEAEKVELLRNVKAMADGNRVVIKQLSGKLNPPTDVYVGKILNGKGRAKSPHKAEHHHRKPK